MKKLIVILLLFLSIPAFSDQNPAYEMLFAKKLDAIKTNSYAAFIENSTDQFSAALNKAQFLDVSSRYGKQLSGGYEKEFQGDFKQQGYDVHLYKVTYADGSPSNLYKMVLSGDKVAGFWIQ